ncbi:hypothetical protein CONPUDRAFT_60624, partial [Coniophora puteana RWD-64-598 SS2]
QVENTLFRVPRHELEHTSRVFRDMFLIPSGADHPEGESDEHPIVLENTCSYDFRQLLRAMLCGPPLNTHREDMGGPDDSLPVTFEEWTSVIKLSHRWEMSAVYQLALKRVSDLKDVDHVEKAAVALTYDIQEWIKSTINDIARRDEPLSRREVDILGIDTVLKIARVRESIGPRGTIRKRSAARLDFGSVITEVFEERFPKKAVSPPKPAKTTPARVISNSSDSD